MPCPGTITRHVFKPQWSALVMIIAAPVEMGKHLLLRNGSGGRSFSHDLFRSTEEKVAHVAEYEVLLVMRIPGVKKETGGGVEWR